MLKLRLITLVSSLILISIITYFNPTAKERIIDKTFQQMNIDIGNEEKKRRGNFFNNWISILYYLPVAILLWSIKKISD